MPEQLGYKYLTRIPGVRAGQTIVENTRIGVHDVIALFATGADMNEVLKSFPELTRAKVFECLAYYEDHKEELNLFVADQLGGRPIPENLVTSEQLR